LNLLSLCISAPSTLSAEPDVNDREDTLFIPEDPPVVLQSIWPASAGRLGYPISQATHLNMASGQMEANRQAEDAKGIEEWSAEDCRLHREFCDNVKRAEEQ